MSLPCLQKRGIIRMIKLLQKHWWMEAIERGVKTAAQAAVLGLSGAVIIEDVHWWAVLSSAGLGAILSILTSIATLPIKEDENAPDTDGIDSDQLQ